jgi:hypothetical protein
VCAVAKIDDRRLIGSWLPIERRREGGRVRRSMPNSPGYKSLPLTN